MRRATMVGTVVIIVAVLAAGCGGDGNGNGNGGVVIGRGPGAPAPVVPDEPANGVDTTNARSAPLATNPTANDVSSGSRSRLEGMVDAENRASAQDIQEALDDWTARANLERNDGAAQLGIGLVLAVAGLYNTAIQLGYTEEDIFGELNPAGLAESALKDLLDVEKVIGAPIAAFFFRPDALTPKDLLAKSDIPGTGDPLLTTEQVQIATRNFALPLIEDAIARLNALAVTAADAEAALITATIDGEASGIYPPEIKALVAALRVMQANLLMFAAYDLDAGDYDWTLNWEDRDANNDGVLTVAEYAPADPFLWRKQEVSNMPDAGQALRDACDDGIWAVQNRGTNSLLAEALQDASMSPEEIIGYLNDLKTLISGQVDVEVNYETVVSPWDAGTTGGVAPAAVATIPLNLAAIWDNPVNDIKHLLPTLHLCCEWGSIEPCPDWGAEPQDRGDFPDLTMHGVFPDGAAIADLVEGEYNHVTVSYGSVQDLVVVEPWWY